MSRALRCFVVAIVAGVAVRDASGWVVEMGRADYFQSVAAEAVTFSKDGDPVVAGSLGIAGATGVAARFAVVALSKSDGSILWKYDAGLGHATAIATDANGNLVAIGSTTPFAPAKRTVVRLLPSGAVGWRRDDADVTAHAVDVDVAGNVFLAGETAAGRAVVTKLDGDTGGTLWAHSVDGAFGATAADVRALPNGDVAAVTLLHETSDISQSHLVVLQLAGLDGAEKWRRDLAGDPSVGVLTSAAAKVDATPQGDVVVAAIDRRIDNHGRDLVIMLTGQSGTRSWTSEQADPDNSYGQSPALAIQADGDVALGTSAGEVVLLARTNGAERWRHKVQCGSDAIEGIAVDPSGDLVATAISFSCFPNTFLYGDPFTRLIVTKLDGDDGSERWRRLFKGVMPGTIALRDTAVGADGRPVIAAAHYVGVGNRLGPTAADFTVLSFDAGDGALDVCNDGQRDADEPCDDGDFDDTNCCSTACRLAVPDGTACNDLDACTVGDACAQGACRPSGPLPCAPCGTCDPQYGCQSTVAVDCKQPTATRKAVVTIDDRSGERRDDFTWLWGSGQATTKADFGDPLGGTGYALCMYGSEGSLILVASIPSNADCARRRCWRSTPRGFVYKSRGGKPDGIVGLTLRAGGAGRASVSAHGAGRLLAGPSLPLDASSVAVRLQTLDGTACWEAEHDVVRTSRGDRFVATNGPRE